MAGYNQYSRQAQNGRSFSNQAGPKAPEVNHTPTSLSRWSIAGGQPPPADKIRSIHIYDFDNTLFQTPLPNPKLWNGNTIGSLSSADVFVNGGWWHDSRILAATGEGIAKEEPRAWEGWWNETIVELVRLSMEQKDALTVLLTGRSESGFGDLVKRMVASKDLKFDLIGLKPVAGPNGERFSTTMMFKQQFLTAVMETYKLAHEIRVYEDRPKHVKGFRDFFSTYNSRLPVTRARQPISAEVIQVADLTSTLDPVIEIAEIQHMINAHNEALLKRGADLRGDKLIIKKTVFFTAYMITAEDTKRLLALAQLPANLAEGELKYHANNIIICPRPCPKSIMDKIGGMGSKMRWEVTGTACLNNSVWAACVRPVPATAKFHTDNRTPLVVLALRKGSRPVEANQIQNWQPIPPERAFTFETTVSEKVLLRIEPENAAEGEYESMFSNKAFKRKHNDNDDNSTPKHATPGGPQGHRNFHSGGRGGRGGGGGGGGGGNFRHGQNQPYRGFASGPRGGRGGGGGRGGRGGGGKTKHHYHSLDDMSANKQGAAPQPVFYDDSSYQPPPTAPKGPSGQQQGGYNMGGGGGAGPGANLQDFY